MYNINLSETQMRIIAEALELYARLRVGQIDSLSDAFMDKTFDRDELDSKLREVKDILFPGMSGYNGIYGKDTCKKAKVSYDVYKEILHVFCKDAEWNVHSSPHEMYASDEKKIKITVDMEE